MEERILKGNMGVTETTETTPKRETKGKSIYWHRIIVWRQEITAPPEGGTGSVTWIKRSACRLKDGS
jgi:hypothetical protein